MGYSCRECKNENTTVCACCSNYMGVPDRFESRPRTNADRIRTMSDEKLAECIYNITNAEIWRLKVMEKITTKEGWLLWLKTEVLTWM